MNRRSRMRTVKDTYAPRERPNEVAAILCVSGALLLLAGVWLDHRGWVPQLAASLFRLLGVGAWYVVVSLLLAARKKLLGKVLAPSASHALGWIALFPLIAGVVQGLSRVSADLAVRCGTGFAAKLFGAFASRGDPGGAVGLRVHNLVSSLLGMYSGTILLVGITAALVVGISEVSLLTMSRESGNAAVQLSRMGAIGVAVPVAWFGRMVWGGVLALHGLVFVLLKDLVTFALRLSELIGHLRDTDSLAPGELATPAGTPSMLFSPPSSSPANVDAPRPEYLAPDGPMVVPLTVPRAQGYGSVRGDAPGRPQPPAKPPTVKLGGITMDEVPVPDAPQMESVLAPEVMKAEVKPEIPIERPTTPPVMIEKPVERVIIKPAEPPPKPALRVVKVEELEREEDNDEDDTEAEAEVRVAVAEPEGEPTAVPGSVTFDAENPPEREPAGPTQQAPRAAAGPIFVRPEQKKAPAAIPPPPKELFNPLPPPDPRQETEDELRVKADRIVDTLRQFRIESDVTHITQGPSVTQFELRPAAGVKLSTISALSNNLAMELATKAIRIEAPIPGKQAVGIEVPNRYMTKVPFQKIIASEKFQSAKSPLAFVVGEDITGEPVVADLARMPHLLVAGTTNSGKSVCINALLASLLARAKPHEVKFILIDPKRVELSVYEDIPHLVTQVVTDSSDAAHALKWAVMEMDRRYQFLSRLGFRNIKGYNEALAAGKLVSPPEMDLPDLPMPYIVVIIDELADLMMVAKKDVEESIVRLTQMARAVGIHVVVATQRPSVNVITGVIKANMPSRIAFAVASKVDSKVILDTIGAEKLLGFGDMLYMPVGEQRATRIQGAFIDDEEVKRLCAYLKQHGPPDYCDIVGEVVEKTTRKADDAFHDDMWEACLRLACERGEVSTSMLQTHLKIGYNRAARIVEEMEARRLISGQETGKRRHVLFTTADIPKQL
jgi:hypothetical protein